MTLNQLVRPPIRWELAAPPVNPGPSQRTADATAWANGRLRANTSPNN